MGLMSRQQQCLLASVQAQLTFDLLGTPAVVQRLRQSQRGSCGSLPQGFAGIYACEGKGVSFKPWGGQETVIPYRVTRQHREALPAGVTARLDAMTIERTRIAVALYDLLPSNQFRPHGTDPDDEAAAAQRAVLGQRDRENDRALLALMPDLLPLAYASSQPQDLFDVAGIAV